MEDLPPQADIDLLHLYWENQRVQLKTVVIIPEDNAAVFTFSNSEDVEIMLSKQHKICKVDVSMYPYYESLGTALYGKDRPRWKIPESSSAKSSEVTKMPPSDNNDGVSQVAPQNKVPSNVASVKVQGMKADKTYQPKAAVVGNIPEHMSSDLSLLGFIVEKISAVSEEDYTMELMFESSIAVVTFNRPCDLERFLTEADISKMFKLNNLSVRVLERTCSLRMEGLPPQANKDLLDFYYETQKVEVNSLIMISEENAAVVTLFEPEDVVDMLHRKHHICKVEVYMYPYYESLGTALYGKDRPRWKTSDPSKKKGAETPSDKQYAAVVVQNIPDEISSDLLGLIIESISGVSEGGYSMEIIYESHFAVVTFPNPNDKERFLSEAQLSKNFQQWNLTARALENTCSLRIEGLPPQANEDLLLIYCEKHGVKIKSILTEPEDNAAVVTFLSPQDTMTMLNTQHKICKVDVSMYPYYESLGTALYGKDRQRWKMPESFIVSIHPALLEFLLEKELTSHISDQMQAHHCQITMKSSDVLLNALPSMLKMKGLTAKYIDDWKENTLKGFHQIMSNYATIEKVLNSDVCSRVVEELQSIVLDHVVMKMDSVTGQLILAGMVKDIDNLRQIVDDKVQETRNQIEREKNTVSEEMDLSADLYNLLQADGLSQHIKGSCPQVSLDYKSSTKKLTLMGLTHEVLSVKNWILERKLQMKQAPVDLDHHIVEYLMTVDSEKMCDHLFFSRGIPAMYVMKDRAVVLMASSEHFLDESVQRMKETLAFQIIAVEDQEVLRKSEWKTVNKQILDMYNTPGKITLLMLSSNQPDNLIVTGFIEPVKEASQILEEFLETNSKIVTVHVKLCAAVQFIKEHKAEEWKRFVKAREVMVNFHSQRAQIKLSGESIYLKPAVDVFKKIANSLILEELKITEPGAKKYLKGKGSSLLSRMFRDYGCVVVLQDDGDDEDDGEGEFGGDETFATFSDSQQCYYKVQMPCGVFIEVFQADICKFQADAVVCPSNIDLKLFGGLSLALLEAAGPQLQTYCDRYISQNGQLCTGDAIITKAGRLPSKYVILTVGPRFVETNSQVAVQHLRGAITESLERASSVNCTSIAIPAISSGIFGFPLDLCTDTIASAVYDYFERISDFFETISYQGRNSLTKVYLVNNDVRTVNAMVQAVKKVFHDMNPSHMPFLSREPTPSWSGNRELVGNWLEGKTAQSLYNADVRPWQSSSTQSYSSWSGNRGLGNWFEERTAQSLHNVDVRSWQSSSTQSYSDRWSTDTSRALENRQRAEGNIQDQSVLGISIYEERDKDESQGISYRTRQHLPHAQKPQTSTSSDEESGPAVLQFCGETFQAVQRAKDRVTSLIMNKLASRSEPTGLNKRK